MMVFCNLTEGGKTAACLFKSWAEFHAATFSTEIVVSDAISLEIHGRTYRDRQNSLRELAIDIQSANKGGLSYGELCDLQGFFEQNGKKLGLLREFRENCIC